MSARATFIPDMKGRLGNRWLRIPDSAVSSYPGVCPRHHIHACHFHGSAFHAHLHGIAVSGFHFGDGGEGDVRLYGRAVHGEGDGQPG